MNQTELNKAAEGGSSPLICCALWIPGDTPDIPKGESRRYWVTIRSKESGRTGVHPMTYMNAHVMPVADCCDPPECAVPHNPEEDGYCEEYEWTGWSNGYCEHCEVEWMWSSHYSEIIAYAPAPEPFLHNTES